MVGQVCVPSSVDRLVSYWWVLPHASVELVKMLCLLSCLWLDCVSCGQKAFCTLDTLSVAMTIHLSPSTSRNWRWWMYTVLLTTHYHWYLSTPPSHNSQHSHKIKLSYCVVVKVQWHHKYTQFSTLCAASHVPTKSPFEQTRAGPYALNPRSSPQNKNRWQTERRRIKKEPRQDRFPQRKNIS